MKNVLKTICVLACPIILIISGCSKSPEKFINNNEITVDGTQKTINVEQNRIGITFCLLNDQGQPATVFRQGENFRFYLSIKNNVQKDTALYIVSDFLSNSDLFRVYDENGTAIGKPLKLSFCYYTSDGINELKRGKEWALESFWHVNNSAETHFLQCYFQGLNQPLLPSGKYYTKLTQQFCLGKYFNYENYSYTPYEFICTNILNLKINFEIK